MSKKNVKTIIIRTDYDNSHGYYYENEYGTVVAIGKQPTDEIVKQVKILAHPGLSLKAIKSLLLQSIQKIDIDIAEAERNG